LTTESKSSRAFTKLSDYKCLVDQLSREAGKKSSSNKSPFPSPLRPRHGESTQIKAEPTIWFAPVQPGNMLSCIDLFWKGSGGRAEVNSGVERMK
jgi:hypothetical protein